ncbi:hypothetical protein BHM03_00039435 [Ensete ventricosum]|nr:hypothetical protein BHM03_00039435 [Ensete ventricosum]
MVLKMSMPEACKSCKGKERRAGRADWKYYSAFRFLLLNSASSPPLSVLSSFLNRCSSAAAEASLTCFYLFQETIFFYPCHTPAPTSCLVIGKIGVAGRTQRGDRRWCTDCPVENRYIQPVLEPEIRYTGNARNSSFA